MGLHVGRRSFEHHLTETDPVGHRVVLRGPNPLDEKVAAIFLDELWSAFLGSVQNGKDFVFADIFPSNARWPRQVVYQAGKTIEFANSPN